MGSQFDEEAKKAAIGGAMGTVAGFVGNPATVKHGPASATAAANFTQTTVHALRHGAPVGAALGAGVTAAVGGPAVVAAAVVAAPFVIGAAAIGVIGYGLFKLFDD